MVRVLALDFVEQDLFLRVEAGFPYMKNTDGKSCAARLTLLRFQVEVQDVQESD